MERADLYRSDRMVTLKIMSRSSKSNRLIPFSKQCIYANLDKIHSMIQIMHGDPILDISKCQSDLEN